MNNNYISGWCNASDMTPSDVKNASWKSWIQCAKWADAPSMIKTLAFTLGLQLKIDVDKGWFRETVRFEVSGKLEDVRRFKYLYEVSLITYEKAAGF